MSDDTKNEQSTTRTPKTRNHSKIAKLELEQLQPFKGHPFQLYQGQQMDDLVDSIKRNGVMQPIHVRPVDDEKYEILSGHNRAKASELAEKTTIPAIVHDSMSDEDAQIFVVESNLNQRSLEGMKLSERANSLYMLNEAMKKKSGHRSDLQEQEDGSQSDNRLRTMHIIGDRYGLSQATIARYIRIAHLSPELQDRLDSKKLVQGAAVRLSYLKPDEQDIVNNLLQDSVKINIEQAEQLKQKSEKGDLSEDEIKEILREKSDIVKKKSISLREDIFLQYFAEDQTPEEIEQTITKALEQYLTQNSQNTQ